MAVDYTKIFTVIGSNVDKVNDYYAYIATFTSDQAALETILSAQSLVRLEGDLVDDYAGLKNDVSNWVSLFVGRVSTVLTDETLIGANFSFGASPSLNEVFPLLIADMVSGDKNVTANTATVGSITKTCTNTLVGTLLLGTRLDGVTPPMEGAIAIPSYLNLTSQLTPTAETLTFTCIADSEGTTERGSEVFEITGTGAGSEAFSPEGENIGNLGNITCIDNLASVYLSNASFDNWTASEPDNWTNEGDSGTYSEGATVVYGTGSSLKTTQADGELHLTQAIDNSLFIRRKSYWLSVWAAKDTDVGSDQTITITLKDDSGVFNSLAVNPTDTAWTNFKRQFVPPIEIVGDVVVDIASGVLDSGNDPVLLDNLVIVPCDYYAGISVAVTSGPDKFLIGDQLSVPISNSNAGKFQTFFRKAFKIQLPTDATPTISDSLVT